MHGRLQRQGRPQGAAQTMVQASSGMLQHDVQCIRRGNCPVAYSAVLLGLSKNDWTFGLDQMERLHACRGRSRLPGEGKGEGGEGVPTVFPRWYNADDFLHAPVCRSSGRVQQVVMRPFAQPAAMEGRGSLLFVVKLCYLGSKVGWELRGIELGDGNHAALALKQTARWTQA